MYLPRSNIFVYFRYLFFQFIFIFQFKTYLLSYLRGTLHGWAFISETDVTNIMSTTQKFIQLMTIYLSF